MVRAAMAGVSLTLLLAIALHSGAWSSPVAAQAPGPGAVAEEPGVAGGAPRVALLHMHDGAWFFQRLGSLTLANKRRYAARWKYEVVSVTPEGPRGLYRQTQCPQGSAAPCFEDDTTFDIDHARAPTFGKIRLARAACVNRPGHWLLWSDADAMVVNQSIPLESIIDDGYDLIYAYDWLMLNAGMLFIKCTPWTEQFLKKVYDAREFDKARALDQSSFQSHLDGLSEAERNAHVKVIPKHAMNVYLEEYRPGDFLLHMAGKLYEATEEGLWAIANQFDVLSQMDDPRSISAFFDTVHLLGYYSGTCNRNVRPEDNNCSPTDKRRIQLREPLGSMSSPNRYRHVSLRYYWMQDWKDKYDVPGWNNKKKALPLPVDGHRSEVDIVQEELREIAAKERAAAAARVAQPPHAAKVETAAKVAAKENLPEVAGDAERNEAQKESVKQAVKQDLEALKNAVANGEASHEGGHSKLLILLACLTLISLAGTGTVLFLKKRRRSLKLQ